MIPARTIFSKMWTLGKYRLAVVLSEHHTRSNVEEMLMARYAYAPGVAQQNVPRDKEFTLGTRKGDSIEELHPGPFEIENEDEPIDLSKPDVRPPGQWLEGWPPK